MTAVLRAVETGITSPAVTAVIAVIVAVFGGGGLAMLLRLGADKGKIVIEAAQGAVVVQTGVIDALQEELNRLKAEVDRLRTERDAEARRRHEQDTELAALRAEVARLRVEGTATAHRVARVEDVTGTDPGAVA